MSTAFEYEFTAGWADLDANAHLRNTAFLDRCVDARMMYFAAVGFPAQEFARRRIGPVVKRDEVEYYRELGLLDRFRIDIALGGISDDASRFRIVNRVVRADGVLAATVVSTGGWLDLDARRLIAPPAEIGAALARLPRTEEFADLKSSLRRSG
jgi:acyl-CoA thioester hydrolase